MVMLLAGIVVALAIGAVVAVLWPAGGVANGVVIDGRDLSGRSRAEVVVVVDDIAERFASQIVQLEAAGQTHGLSTAELGLVVDRADTVSRVMDARKKSGLGRFQAWLDARTGTEQIDLALTRPSTATISAALETLSVDLADVPVEPVVVRSRGSFVATNGVAGQTWDAQFLSDQLPDEVRRSDATIALDGVIRLIPTELSQAAAESAVTELNVLTADGITLRLLQEEETISAATVRSWLVPTLTADGYTLDIDRDRVRSHVAARFSSIDRVGSDASFTVADGVPKIVPPLLPGLACCADDSGDRVLDALLQGETSARLAARANPSARGMEWARSLGVVELIGEFTTNHACCQGRVTNIQRMADLVQGAIIEPGALFSLNDHVGKRTRQQGFVDGGVIYNGEFTEDVGGGVSQFVTTLFNAAFFGGLDFGEYKSHSRYIPRYPYGREATISWRKPEFEIVNSTPYGVLIWPEYTPTSITVKLYSTRFASGFQTDQSTFRVGQCRAVTTERTRLYEDGRHTIDTVVAHYRDGSAGYC